jgi:hypothetical protein
MKKSKRKVKFSSALQVRYGAAFKFFTAIAVIIGVIALLSGFICAMWQFGYVIAYIGLGAVAACLLNRFSKRTIVVDKEDAPKKEYKK